jgi:hypothetical protein
MDGIIKLDTTLKIEAQLDQCESTLVEKLAIFSDKPHTKAFLLMAFLAPLIFFLNFEFLNAPKISRFDVAYFGRTAFFCVCLGSILAPWLSMKWRPIWLFLVCALAWFAQSALKMGLENKHALLLGSLPIPSLLIAMFLLHRSTAISWRIKTGILALVFCALATIVAPNSNGSTPYLLFWSIQPEFFLFLFPFIAKEVSTQSKFIWLNPANILAGTLWPSSKESSDTKSIEYTKIWAQGLFDLIRSQLFILAAFLLPIEENQFFEYIFRLFVMMGVANAISGVARIYGFDIPNATNHLLLMRMPTEYWRRGASYIYLFLFKNIYFPIVRKTKKNSLAIIVCMLAMFFHSTMIHGLLLPIIHSLPINKYPIFYGFFITALWIPLFYLSGHRWSAIFAILPSQHRQWFMILATHALIMGLYFLAKFSANWLMQYS